jgi:hypothetical protein
MVLLEGIELSTSPLPRECSTTELQQPAKARGGFIGCLYIGRNPALIDTAAASPQIPPVTEPPTPQDAKPEPHLTPAAARARAEREARAAEALRANLRRRKAQARGRDAQQEAQPEGGSDGSHSLYPDISDKL